MCDANPSYDADERLAEFYDLTENHAKDVALLRKLLLGRGRLRIFEPFCGTGRVLIPLAQDGHELVGMDLSRMMLKRAEEKLARLDAAVRQRVQLICADCTAGPWPRGFDVVLLASNCLYELATAQEQERCVRLAWEALKPGGHVFLDNNHMEGDLDESWCNVGVVQKGYPNGTCADATQLEGTSQVIWIDRPRRLWRAKRELKIRFPDGRQISREWIQQKHPPSIREMRAWLEQAEFDVEASFGDRDGGELTDASPRAIFWARRS